MRCIFYDELSPNHGFPKMIDSLEVTKYPYMDEIIRYLKSGTIEFARVSHAKDVFNGKTIPQESVFMNDGIFAWSSDLAWYVEKYNLRLPKDFESHILKNI